VHEILSFLVFLLNSGIVSGFLNKGEEELEFLLIEGVLHREHVVVAIVEDQIGDALLASLDGDSKSRNRCLFRLNLI